MFVHHAENRVNTLWDMSRPELRKLIRKACEKHELSIVALAREAGVTRNTIYNWEGGITAPALDELSKVAKRLELPLSALVDAWDGKTQKEGAPGLPARLDEVLGYLRLIARGVPVKDEDLAAIEELHHGVADATRNGRLPGAPRRKAGRRPPGT